MFVMVTCCSAECASDHWMGARWGLCQHYMVAN